MDEKIKLLDSYLVRISDNLDVTETMRKKAIESYSAVGFWLGDCDENSLVKIIPQGSFNLGTVIRPISDFDEYDVDLVCLLRDKKGKSLSEIKNCVGDRLKENQKYRKMLNKKEGKRCWTLNYDEFHMDILPCVPNEKEYLEPNNTEIKLTHKIGENNYIPKYSNPYKYREWFIKQMEQQFIETKKSYAQKNGVEIEQIPFYAVKTTLQRSIQLLKRYRDVMYDKLPNDRKDNAPISIIITTLAAYAYNNESSVYEALKNIILNMENYIKKDENGYKILNPVMEKENFAEKWNNDKKIAEEFFKWIQCAKKDITNDLISSIGLDKLSRNLETCFGQNIVKRSVIEEGNYMKESRENKTLYVNGLKGGLTTLCSNTSKKVGGHTFFGK